MAALRAAIPDKDINEQVSEYYIASGNFSHISWYDNCKYPEPQWDIFRQATVSQMATLLFELAGQIDLLKFKKHKRGPKKPPPLKTKYKGKPHVSTAKLIAWML